MPPRWQRDRAASLRIMLVANTGWNILRFRLPLVEALVERQHNVTVVADFRPEQLAEAERPGVRPFTLPIDAAGIDPRADLRYAARLYRLIRRVRPDVVHLFTVKPIVYGTLAAKLAGTPGIVAALTGSGIAQAGRRRWLTPVVRNLLRVAFSGRTQAIFQNEADLAAFAKRGLVRSDHAFLVPGSGIDTTRLTPTPDDHAPRTTFLMASRMLWSKGVGDFVEAARIVKTDYPGARFALFGGAQDEYGSKNPDFIARGWLEALNAEGIVSWHGWTRPELVETEMRRAAAVVLPSSYGEGVPRSLTEAAAAGSPIITTDTPGCRDAVLPGASGFVCSAGAPQEIAAAMIELLRRPELVREMGARGRVLAVERFDQSHVVRRTLEVYAAALPTPRPRISRS
jgi:glycosyltransferase involved in cell wall biosynthesis